MGILDRLNPKQLAKRAYRNITQMSYLEIAHLMLNSAAFTAASLEFGTKIYNGNVECLTELPPDIFIHLFEILFAKSFNDLGLGLNLLRAAQATTAALTGNVIFPCTTTLQSCTPKEVSLIDSALHLANATSRANHLVKDIQNGVNTVTGTVLSYLPSWKAKTASANGNKKEELKNANETDNKTDMGTRLKQA